MTLHPTQDRVLIEIDERTQSDGGIHIPETANHAIREGTVAFVGPGQRNLKNGELIPVDVKRGDKVLFTMHEGNEIEHEGKKYFLIQAPRIIAIIS